MVPNFDAIVFVNNPPEFIIDDGLVHIVQRFSDRVQIERVMRLHVFLQTVQLAKEAVAAYEKRGIAEVIPFPKRAH